MHDSPASAAIATKFRPQVSFCPVLCQVAVMLQHGISGRWELMWFSAASDLLHPDATGSVVKEYVYRHSMHTSSSGPQ